MLSTIIATFNCERALVRTLAALVPAAATGVVREVIVADRGSTDETLAVADVAGCTIAASEGSLAQGLRTAAMAARSPWLMFLQPGTVLEPAWADEAAQFVQQVELSGFADHAASFRTGARLGSTTMMAEAMSLFRAALIGRVDPAQGLVIGKTHYERLGGHRPAAANPEADLLRRIGRRRITVLRSSAVGTAR
jgi:glycosyltransferase involved in cell wall biosynthesis